MRIAFMSPAVAMILAFVLTSAGCATREPAGEQGLARVDYEKVMLDPVAVQFDESWRPVRTGSHVRLSGTEMERAREQVAELFDAAFRAELAEGDIELVENTGPGVLRITPVLSDVDIRGPLEPMAVPVDIYTRYIAQATLEIDFRDGASNALLFRLRDTMQGRDMDLRRVTPAMTRMELSRMFRKWARIIREDVFHEA